MISVDAIEGERARIQGWTDAEGKKTTRTSQPKIGPDGQRLKRENPPPFWSSRNRTLIRAIPDTSIRDRRDSVDTDDI